MITLKDNETLHVKVRKHWFVFVRDILGLVFLALLPILIIFALEIFEGGLPPVGIQFVETVEALSVSLIAFAYALWLLLLWMKTYIVWTDYYLDTWYITDVRILDVEQKGFFRREISSINFDRIQDVTVEIHGIIATFLDFGTIHVQSAGAMREFIIEGVPRPYQIKEQILSYLKGDEG